LFKFPFAEKQDHYLFVKPIHSHYEIAYIMINVPPCKGRGNFRIIKILFMINAGLRI